MIICIFIKQSFRLYVLVLNKINKKNFFIILVLPLRNLLLQNKKKYIYKFKNILTFQ